MSGDAMLRVEGLHSYYGRAHILADVSLHATGGELVVVLGRNGAGKTTTLKCIMGIVPPARGAITFAGRDITGLAPYLVNRAGLAYVPEDRRIFTELTVLENLVVGRQPPRQGAPVWTIERLFSLFPTWPR